MFAFEDSRTADRMWRKNRRLFHPEIFLWTHIISFPGRLPQDPLAGEWTPTGTGLQDGTEEEAPPTLAVRREDKNTLSSHKFAKKPFLFKIYGTFCRVWKRSGQRSQLLQEPDQRGGGNWLVWNTLLSFLVDFFLIIQKAFLRTILPPPSRWVVPQL